MSTSQFCNNLSIEINTYGDLKRALELLTPQQLEMSITVSEGCDSSGNAEFFDCNTIMLAGNPALESASDGVIESDQPVLLFGTARQDF